MRKIPTLFVRDENDRSKVTDEVTPGCEWVLASEGVATRMYDGICVIYDGAAWWARREVKAGKAVPENFQMVEHNEVTGKTVGWEPIEQSSFYRFYVLALAQAASGWVPGTYELCGPKIKGNPEGFVEHRLIRHALAQTIDLPTDLTVTRIKNAVRTLSTVAYGGWEGIVWHHPDGRMAKLKARDL